MAEPKLETIDDEAKQNTVEPKAETIGDRVKQNYAGAEEFLAMHKALYSSDEILSADEIADGDALLAQSSTLLLENKALINNGNFHEEITKELTDKINGEIAKAPIMTEQEQQATMGRHQFLLFIQNITGMDFSDPKAKFDVFDIFNAVMHMGKEGAMDDVMAQMQEALKGMDDKSPKEKFEIAKDAANEAIEEMKPPAADKELKDLGGKDGSAVTYNINKEPDQLVGSNVMDNGASVAGVFNNNTTAIGSLFNSREGLAPAVTEPMFDINQPAANADQYSMSA